MKTPDAIVVGAGIVGAACARALARDDRRVLVLDAAPGTAGGATAAGMGHIIITDDSEAQFELCHRSQQLWDELAPEFPVGVQRDECGCVWVAVDDEDLEAAQQKRDYYAARGIRAEVLDQRQLREAEPALAHELVGGLRVPGDTVVYPPAAAEWLLAETERRDGQIRRNAEVVAVASGAVTLADGSALSAPIIVNAAGDRALHLLPDPRLHDLVRPRKGHLAITERGRPLIRHQVAELGYFRSAHGANQSSVAFNVQPRTTGQTLIGSSRQFGATHRAVDHGILARMLERAMELLPGLADLRVIRTWTGFRAATADKLPYIGPVPGHEGLFVATGHEGLGITTSLGTGGIIAAQVRGETPFIDAAPYRLDRPVAEWSVA
ncbi:MAG: FAD-dependent oxidoreductase [Acidobacteria bacterium]|nr:FAD-dependent oxidoreductase [Acidobacteriota bacterium]